MFSSENGSFKWEIDLSREQNGNGRPKPALFACPQGAQLKDTEAEEAGCFTRNIQDFFPGGRRLDSRHTSASPQAYLVAYLEARNISAFQCYL